MDNELTFEKAMNRLNEITELIQNNKCSLEDSLKLFEEGVKLSKYCSEKLEQFDEKLKALTQEG